MHGITPGARAHRKRRTVVNAHIHVQRAAMKKQLSATNIISMKSNCCCKRVKRTSARMLPCAGEQWSRAKCKHRQDVRPSEMAARRCLGRLWGVSNRRCSVRSSEKKKTDLKKMRKLINEK